MSGHLEHLLRAIAATMTGLFMVAASACHFEPESGDGEAETMTRATKSALKTIASSRIFFLHQSVGFNMLDGLRGLFGDAGETSGRIVQAEQDGIPTGAALIHSSGGRNKYPDSKIDAFAESLRTLEGLEPDVAFMKLCYVDFNKHTDLEKVLDHYRSTIETLKGEFPRVLFAHATVPLKTQSTSLKDRLYRSLGREVWSDESNIKRNKFSRRLRETFPDDPIIDVARAESTGPDGSRLTFSQDGEVYSCMHPAYSDDGGHLNARGQRIVAEEMVRTLAGALAERGGREPR